MHVSRFTGFGGTARLLVECVFHEFDFLTP